MKYAHFTTTARNFWLLTAGDAGSFSTHLHAENARVWVSYGPEPAVVTQRALLAPLATEVLAFESCLPHPPARGAPGPPLWSGLITARRAGFDASQPGQHILIVQYNATAMLFGPGVALHMVGPHVGQPGQHILIVRHKHTATAVGGAVPSSLRALFHALYRVCC